MEHVVLRLAGTDSPYRTVHWEGNRSKGSWLFGIAHQKCLQRWRKQGREEIVLEEIAAASTELGDDPADWVIRQEEEAEFMALLNRLPQAQRSVLLLHFVEDFSLEEIAGITGAVLGTVKSRLHYAKKTLRKLIQKKGS